MKKQNKKRKRKQYGLGGVMKRHIETPNEAIRDNQIRMAKAEEDVFKNPWLQGVDMFGHLAMQVGSSMMSQGAEEVAPEDAIGGVPFLGSVMESAAMGTSKEGFKGGKGVPVEVEEGEVLEDPQGNVTKEGGKKHSEGGNKKIVQEGTIAFSDQVKIGGKTSAERKIAREKREAQALKVLDADPTDAIAKETYNRIVAQNEVEEQSDLKVQEVANRMDEVYNAAMGTGPEGFTKLDKGTPTWGATKKGIGDFFKGFTGGDALSLMGNAYTGLSAISTAKENAATNQVNVNQMQGVGDEAIKTTEEALGGLGEQKGLAEKSLQDQRTSTMKSLAGKHRGVNTSTAATLALDQNMNKAMADLYSNFSKMMMEGMLQKAGMQGKFDAMEKEGAERADIANRMDKDNEYTQLGVAKETMGRAIQTMGKDLNENAVQNYMSKVYNEMFANPVQWARKGGLEKSDK